MEKLKIGTIIEITNDTGDVHWHKGEIGRIVDKMPGGIYLICFDENCTNTHRKAGGHTGWVADCRFKPIQLKKLMTVD